MTATDYIIEYLVKNSGVTHAFTYAGGTDAPILDSMHRNKGITYIPVRHEENAALAACGYALASEQLGLAVSMGGPGATNMVTGIANAWFDSIPVMFLTGQVTTGTYKFDNPARQKGYQEADIVSIVKSITKEAELVCDKNYIHAKLKKFVSKARSGRPGPVLLDVPFDTLRQDIPKETIKDVPVWDDSPRIGDDVITMVCDMIDNAKRPIIIAGGGIKTDEARELLFRLSELTKIPVVTSLMGRDAFPNDNKRYFGFIGAYGNRYANIALANSDLIIAIGTRLDSRQTASTRLFGRDAKKIHVDIDKNELNNNVNCDVSIHADIRDFMWKLMHTINEPWSQKYDKWMAYHARLKADFDPVTDGVGTEEGVHPKRFLKALSELNDAETVYVTDVGNNQMFCAQSLVVKHGQRFLASGGLGTMGFAIPASIGAAFAQPDMQIIAIMGDGGFQMAIQELQTIVHFNIPVKMIVLNNGILGLMKVFQDENYKGAYPATVDGYSVPDLGKIANAYGIAYKKVETTEEALAFVPEFLFTNKPFILEVSVHPDWTGYPKGRRGLGSEHQEPTLPEEVLSKYMLIPMVPEK